MTINNFIFVVGVLPNGEQHSLTGRENGMSKFGETPKLPPTVLDLRITSIIVGKFFNALYKKSEEPNELIESSIKGFNEFEKYINEKFCNRLTPGQKRDFYEDVYSRLNLFGIPNSNLKNIADHIDKLLIKTNTQESKIKTKREKSGKLIAESIIYLTNKNNDYKNKIDVSNIAFYNHLQKYLIENKILLTPKSIQTAYSEIKLTEKKFTKNKYTQIVEKAFQEYTPEIK